MKLRSNLAYFSFILLLHNSVGASHMQRALRQINISTVQAALSAVRRSIANYTDSDTAAAQAYEKQHSPVLVQCAKVLYDNACEQILQALQEIDKRKAYWLYQKNNQWSYFS